MASPAANRDAHLELVGQLRAKLDTAALGGPQRARERHVARGKLLPRERVDGLLDPGSPFLEVAPLAADGMYDDECPAAGIITGIGRVAGTPAVRSCPARTRCSRTAITSAGSSTTRPP